MRQCFLESSLFDFRDFSIEDCMSKRLQKWVLTSTPKVKTIQELFAQLPVVNNHSKSFSYRAVALKLKWPRGYIAEHS